MEASPKREGTDLRRFCALALAVVSTGVLVLGQGKISVAQSGPDLRAATAPQSKASSPRGIAEMPTLSSAELYDAGSSVLLALQDFYLASLESKQVSSDQGDNAPATAQIMVHLFNEQRNLKRGCIPLQKLQNNRNKAVRVAATGSIAGAEAVIKADDELLQLLRSPAMNSGDWTFKMAQAASAKQDGYMTIAKAAPWVTIAMFAMVDDPPQSGPIPYYISTKQRRALLEQINSIFGKEIEKDATAKDNHNFIIIAATLFQRNLIHDTYEGVRSDDGESQK
jgi:hypothetical protein